MPYTPMKYSLLFLLTLLCHSALFGQNSQSYCDVQFTESQTQWLKAFQQAGQFSLPQNKSKVFIPIKAHIVGTNAGAGYYPAASLLDAICNINSDFESIGFHFYLKGDINYINNTVLYNFSYNTYWNHTSVHEDPSAINIFFVSSTPGFCGVYMGGDDIIVIKNECQKPGGNTLTHELGHFFNLPHTFRGWENGNTPASSMQEYKDRSNCQYTGDGFCDTYPDYVATRWNCPTGPLLTDPKGETFRPDGTLYMSYSNDECMNRFSDEQLATIVANRLSRGLIGMPLVTDSIGAVTLAMPENDAQNKPRNGLVFNWSKVPGATQYEIQIVNISGFSVPLFDFIVSDTFFVASNLPADRKLEWRVKAIKPGYTCAPYSEIRNFTTGTNQLPTTVDEALMSNSWFQNPVKAGEPIEFHVTEGAVFTITDMSGKQISALERNPVIYQSGLYLVRVETEKQTIKYLKLLVID